MSGFQRPVQHTGSFQEDHTQECDQTRVVRRGIAHGSSCGWMLLLLTGDVSNGYLGVHNLKANVKCKATGRPLELRAHPCQCHVVLSRLENHDRETGMSSELFCYVL